MRCFIQDGENKTVAFIKETKDELEMTMEVLSGMAEGPAGGEEDQLVAEVIGELEEATRQLDRLVRYIEESWRKSRV